jgi:uncharacterized low-complexity protein
MKLVIAVACLAASLSLATHALADGTTATLQQPIAKKVQFIVNGAIWDCSQSTCVSDNANANTSYFGPGECHDVAKHAHVAITEFKADGKTLQAAALDQCNAGVAPKTTTASR